MGPLRRALTTTGCSSADIVKVVLLGQARAPIALSTAEMTPVAALLASGCSGATCGASRED